MVGRKISSFEQRYQNFEQHLHTFSLFVRQVGCSCLCSQFKIRMLEDEFEKVNIGIREKLVDFLVFVISLFALFQNESIDCKWQAKHGDYVRDDLPEI